MSPQEVVDTEWQTSAGNAGWSLRTKTVEGTYEFWLQQGGADRCRVPLSVKEHGAPSAVRWLSDANGQPRAAAIGTAGNANVYIFGLAEQGEAPLIRQFRGHSGAVTCLANSPDDRLLASGAQDGTIRCWSLDQLWSDSKLLNRWGVALRLQDGELFVEATHPAGPLHFRGVRPGDSLGRVRYRVEEDGTTRTKEVNDPSEILRTLETYAWDQMIAFHFTPWASGHRSVPILPGLATARFVACQWS